MLHPQLLSHLRSQYKEPDPRDKEALLVASPMKGTGDQKYRVLCLRDKSSLSVVEMPAECLLKSPAALGIG